ncbi:hypothetical protein ACFOPP_08390 [Sphingobium sp. GCM10012300]
MARFSDDLMRTLVEHRLIVSKVGNDAFRDVPEHIAQVLAVHDRLDQTIIEHLEAIDGNALYLLIDVGAYLGDLVTICLKR